MSAKEMLDMIFFYFPGLTQKALAEFLGITESVVSGWRSEKSKPRIDQLTALAERLCVDINWLTSGKTSSIKVLSNILFPVTYYSYTIYLDMPYNFARKSCAYSIANITDDEKFKVGITAIDAFMTMAQDEQHPLNSTINFLDIGAQGVIGLIFKAAHLHDLPEKRLVEIGDYVKDVLKYYIQPEIYESKQIDNTTTIRNKIAHGKIVDPSIIKELVDTKLNDLMVSIGNELFSPQTSQDFYEIPYFPDGIAAGNPKEIKDYPEEKVILHKDWCSHPDETSAAKLDDSAHSMEPTIMAGSIITVDHHLTNPEELDGEVVAIYKKDDGVTVKRLKKIGSRWCGIPDNSEYDVVELEDGDRIVGLVTTHHNLITNKR